MYAYIFHSIVVQGGGSVDIQPRSNMSMHHCLALLCFVHFCEAASGAPQQEEDAPPHIILVLADDWGALE